MLDKIRRGDRRSLAKAMSLVDQPGDQGRSIEDSLRRSTGQVPWWGLTGPPGVGKSTLIDTLLTLLRRQHRRIGVVAIDPTSPLSDGALLGDRVRMMRHATDENVFIRSLATHRREGGLSDATTHCAGLLELAGYDPVLIETVGVGQNEVDIASVADICVVVLGPGHGDDIQLIKAGLLEIADIIVVNKCDLAESNRLLRDVREEVAASSLAGRAGGLDSAEKAAPGESRKTAAGIDVVGVEAKSGKGVEELLEKLFELDRLARGSRERERHGHRRALGEIRRSAMLAYEGSLDRQLAGAAARGLVDELQRGERSLGEVVSQLVARTLTDLQRPETGTTHGPSKSRKR